MSEFYEFYSFYLFALCLLLGSASLGWDWGVLRWMSSKEARHYILNGQQRRDVNKVRIRTRIAVILLVVAGCMCLDKNWVIQLAFVVSVINLVVLFHIFRSWAIEVGKCLYPHHTSE